MASPSSIDQIAERVERLLLRHAELQRTNALLAQQVARSPRSAIPSNPACRRPVPA